MNPSRRGFLSGMLGLVAAPAIVRVGSLMPVKAVPDVTLERVAAEYFADRMVLPLPYKQEFIRAFEMQQVTQQLRVFKDGTTGVEMRYANGKADFIPMS